MRHEFCGGNYSVINDNGTLTSLRNGEPWGRDLVGDNLVYWMLVEVDRLKAERRAALELLSRARDAIEALDGTSVENERLVDDYRAAMAAPDFLA